ncbi:MAG: site-specific integrase, partial [Alphaproteobacteria bacterium]
MATVRKRNWRAASGEEKTAWIADYFDGAGKRHIKTFRTRKAADEWLVNARGEVQRGTHTPENASITVREAAALWLERCALEGLERSTLRFYKIHVDLHILPRIGGERLARLTTPRIEAFRDALLRDDVSRATARKALTTFKSILTDAQRRGLLAHNVASPVRIDIKRRESGKLVVGRYLPSPA